MRHLILAASLGSAAVLGLAMPASAQVQQAISPADGTVLELTAEGRTSRVPDVAVIRAGVVSQAATAAAALADNAARIDRVIAALKRAGVADRDMQTANISLQPQYKYTDNQPPQLIGYQASNSVSVRFRDIAKSGAILDALVAQGANQIDGPNLMIDKPDAALDEARADAMAKARARANLYARAAGLTVSKILTISESGENAGVAPPPMPMYMARADAAPATKLVAGERDVTVNLTVRFLLK